MVMITSENPVATELVKQHYELLYKYTFRLSGSAPNAEDLTQQTFLIAHVRLHQLRIARGTGCSES